MPFLTEIDHREKVKGSRDPLSLVPVWSRFGRRVIGNLTTVSNSVRGFTTLLLGYYFAEQVHDRHGPEAGSTLDLFLKFEQLAAYCRHHVNGDKDFRGVERVSTKLESSSTVRLGAGQDLQILSNQKVYGLWGLFSVPARNSGLLEQDSLVLTPVARAHVESILRGMREPLAIAELISVASPPVYLDGRHQDLCAALGKLLRPKLSKSEAEFYRTHLLHGGDRDPTTEKQRRLAGLLGEAELDGDFDMDCLYSMARQAQERGWDDLAKELKTIAALEPLLVAASQAFSLLCSRDGAAVGTVADELARSWKGGLSFLRMQEIELEQPAIAEAFSSDEAAGRLLRIGQLLREGRNLELIHVLLEHNAFVMTARGGGPWVRAERDTLKVHFQDEAESLSSQSDLRRAWRNTYFINSLQRVVETVERSG